ncbi:hypothetical protein [Brevibacillus reuszeri]|uniref:hypothetical protein n=1 Tax=Brevibacillus reuszeri TaxID=54915 RepID=UPI00289BDC1B|nr:hypothetical protein [Brevibacillus reuszeri]
MKKRLVNHYGLPFFVSSKVAGMGYAASIEIDLDTMSSYRMCFIFVETFGIPDNHSKGTEVAASQ